MVFLWFLHIFALGPLSFIIIHIISHLIAISYDHIAFYTDLGAILGRLGAILGPSWGHFGASLGPSWGQLGL